MKRQWVVRLKHIFREGNMPLMPLQIWITLPLGQHRTMLSNAELSHWVLYDVVGGCEARQIVTS
ncbi:hypothetical protein LINGRAHAP2_LOCUS7745 [Linum grandiflorum]